MDIKNSSPIPSIDYTGALKKVKRHVLLLFQLHENNQMLYHSRSHTEQVVDACAEMADYYHLNEKEAFIVKTAAWFHDTGYFDTTTEHEKAGAQKAEIFLREEGVDMATITAIKGCIFATSLPQHPANLLEEIVCDADFFHFGKDGFFKKNKMLREELSILKNESINKKEWQQQTLQLMQQHHYFTDYGRRQLNEKKLEHMAELKEKIASSNNNNNNGEGLVNKQEKADKVEKERKEASEKRMEVIFRITSTNNLRLSNMADSKAHIMITVNSIIISILLSVLVRNIDKYDYLTVPVILLLVVDLVTIFFSMLATKPRLPQGKYTEVDVDERKVSLLFFGNYYRMNFDDYAASLTRIMEDKTELQLNLIRDIYSQGVLLSKKYRMLKVAYLVFMYGLIGSVIAFVIAAELH